MEQNTTSKYYQEALEEYRELCKDEEDAWDKRIDKTGCYVENMALQLCHAETNDWRKCLGEMALFPFRKVDKVSSQSETVEMGSVGKKKGKRKSLLNLRGALKGLLTAQNSNNSSVEPPVLSTTNLEEDLSDTSKQTETSEFSSNPQHLQPQDKHGIVYIMSKEAQLIPKLTDEQVLERHKRADENMKRAWSRLIQKYESIGDEGDVLDLNTGEIIEDNGHIRGLSTFDATVNSANDNYVSVLSDLLEIDKATGNVWQEDEEEEEEGDFEKEDGSSSESDGANDHDEFAEVGQDL